MKGFLLSPVFKLIVVNSGLQWFVVVGMYLVGAILGGEDDSWMEELGIAVLLVSLVIVGSGL